MKVNESARNERINLRLNKNAKALIERAAGFEGKAVSQFILFSALASAEKTVREHDIMALNARESQRFFDALSRPVRFNKKLTEALAEHSRRVTAK